MADGRHGENGGAVVRRADLEFNNLQDLVQTLLLYMGDWTVTETTPKQKSVTLQTAQVSHAFVFHHTMGENCMHVYQLRLYDLFEIDNKPTFLSYDLFGIDDNLLSVDFQHLNSKTIELFYNI